jgi:hypothetical protein
MVRVPGYGLSAEALAYARKRFSSSFQPSGGLPRRSIESLTLSMFLFPKIFS